MNDLLTNKFKNFVFKRGYIISNTVLNIDNALGFSLQWKSLKFKNYYILYDPDNEIYYQENGNNFVLLLGSFVDTQLYTANLSMIASKIIDMLNINFDLIYDYLNFLSGRYIIICSNQQKTILFNDACGLRSVFYHSKKLFVSSHYNLINLFVNESAHPYYDEFEKIKINKPYVMPGDISPYMNIYSLIPNHELNLKDLSIKRYWPYKDHHDISINDAIEFISNTIQKTIMVLHEKYKLMIQLSNGNDSRVSLAASKTISDVVLYYSYLYKNDKAIYKDANNAKNICERLKLNFILADIDSIQFNKQDYNDLLKILYINHWHKHLPSNVLIFNKVLPNDRLAIRSNIIEIIRHGRYDYFNAKLDANAIANIVYPKNMINTKTLELFENFYIRNEYNKIYNYCTPDMLYWEWFHGLWLSSVLLQDDLNYDTFLLLNNRKILEYGLSIPRYYKTQNTLIYEITKKLWKDVLYDIPNTNYTLEDYFVNYNLSYELNDSYILSGNVNNIERKVDFYHKIRRYSYEFGFATNNVLINDFITWKKLITIDFDSFYLIQLNIVIPYIYPFVRQVTKYNIYINNTLIYHLPLENFQNKNNQINIIKYFHKNEKANISIQLICTENFDNKFGIAGFMKIENLYFTKLQKKFKDKDHCYVFSTYDKFQEII